MSALEPVRALTVDAWLRLLPSAFSRAMTRAVAAGLVIATGMTIVLGIAFGSGQLLSPYSFWPYPVVAAAVATAVWPFALGRGVREAYEAFSWLGRWEVNRFRSQTGSAVPTDRDAVRTWLAQHPSPGFGGYARIEMLAWIDDLAGAREELAAFPDPTDPADEAEQIGLGLWLDLLERGSYDPEPLHEAIRHLPRGAGRSRAEVNLALLDARGRVADGRRDWWGPLADVRVDLGGAASLVVVRDTLTRIFLVQLIASVLLGGTLALVTAIL
jgi:hypothetical protein